MSAQQDFIYPGDSYTVHFECLKPKPTVSGPNLGGIVSSVDKFEHYPPTSATAMLMNTIDETFVEIGGPNSTEAPAQVDGHIVRYTVPGEFTIVDEVTEFALFIRVTWPGPITRTFRFVFSVQEFR